MLLVNKVLYLQCLDFFWVILVVLTPRFRHVIGVLVLVIHHLVTVTVNPVWPHLPAFLLLTGLVSISLPLTDLLCECSIDRPQSPLIPPESGDLARDLHASP